MARIDVLCCHKEGAIIFRQLDADADGKVTKEEWLQFLKKRMQKEKP